MHNPKSSISVYMLMDVTTNFNIKDEKELLQFALEKRIIDVESIKNVVADMTRKEILAQHNQEHYRGRFRILYKSHNPRYGINAKSIFRSL